MQQRKNYPFIVVVAVVLIAMAFGLVQVELALTKSGIAVALPNGELTDAQGKSIDLIFDVSTQLINWTFAIIGGASLFIKLRIESKIELSLLDLALTAVTILLAVASLYLSQVAFDILVRSLVLQQFPFDSPGLYIAFRWQFILGLSALVSLGLQVTYFLYRLIGDSNE